MTIATSTLAQSVGAAMEAFGELVLAAAADATALCRTVRGLDDGKDYGRYFAGEDPLVPFASSASSVAAMIAEANQLRQAVISAVETAESDAAGNSAAFPADVAAVLEALRQACADPNDALRLLSGLAGFSIKTPFDGKSSRADPAAALAAAVYFAAGTAVAGQPLVAWPLYLADPLGFQIAALTASAARVIRRAAAIALARAAADYVPSSYQDAIRVRDLVDTVLEAAILEAGDTFDDGSYAALTALHARVIEDLAARGAALAPIVTRRFGASQPALVLAYRLYQDATREGDILARNDCPHPALLPATLELLAA